MKILRPILNEEFLDDLDDRMISDALPQDNVVADEDAYPYEFMFTVSAIGKKVTPKQYTDNIKRLFKLLNKSFAISTKIAGFRELGPDTPIYVYWKRYQCNASRNVDGLDMHWMASYAGKKYDDLDDLIKSVKEFTFYVNFQLDVNSAASIAQAVSKIITIFCSCVRSVYSSTVNPRNIWLSNTKDKQTRNDSYGLIEMKESFAYQLEQGDLSANGDLWKLMHQMNPLKFDNATAQKESWAYLESRYGRIGYTPFINEVAAHLSVPMHELRIDDDKAHRTVTFYIPLMKRFTFKLGDEMRKLVENNNYTMKIKGGSVIKFYGSEEALKWLSEVIADSGINQLKYVPENDNYARLKKANGKNGDPIDVVKIMHGMYCEIDTKGDEKRDGGTMWDVEYIHPKYRVSKGIVEVPKMLYYSKHKTF